MTQYNDSKTKGMKPDKLCHVGSDYKTAKQNSEVPGQMYVPKVNNNESTFATLSKNNNNK